MRRYLVAAALLGAFALIDRPATAQTTPQPPGLVVHIKMFKFVPPSATVKPGTTVEFVNDDEDAHTVTATDRSFDSGGLDTNASWTHTFAKAGTYRYFCAVHPYMKGVITVSAR